MKKTLLILAIIGMTTSYAVSQFGVQAGGMATNMQWDSDLFSVNTKIKPGFLFGVTYDIPLANNMVINSALNYKQNGTWIKDDKDVTAVRLNYMNLDVTYNYIFNISNLEIYAEGGGYAAYGIGGKMIFRPESGDTETEDIKFGTDENNDDLKPFDGGLTIGAGIYFGQIKLGIGYMHGITNLSLSDANTIRNRSGYIRAAYIFGRE